MWICQTCNYRDEGNRTRHIHQPLGHSIAMPHFQTRLEFVLRAFANRTFISQTLSFIIFISYRLLNLIWIGFLVVCFAVCVGKGW